MVEPERPTGEQRGAPAGRSPFVGRQDLLDHLGAALALARRGTLAGVLLGGPSGIGKSRLLEEFCARDLPGVGRRLRSGGRRDDRGLVPLEAVRALVDLTGAGAVPSSAESREQLYQAVATAVRRTVADGDVLLVVLEDLHWADVTSLELLPYLVRRLSDAPVLLVGTYRDGHEITPELRDLLVTFDRSASVTRLEVPPLPAPQLADLISHRLGRVPDERTLQQVLSRSAGITLFAEELARTIGQDEPGAVPTSLRDMFVGVLDRLGTGTRELADLAAVCGDVVRHDFLVEVADLPEPTLEKQLDELIDVGVLVVEPSGDAYRFRHDLLHETVGSVLRPGARRRLHVRCARALTARPDLARSGRSAVSEVVRHWHGAGDPSKEFHALLAAAAEASASRAYAEAHRLELRALDLHPRLLPEDRDGITERDLLVRAGETASRAGEHARAAELVERALAGTTEPSARAALHVPLAVERHLAGDTDAAARAGLAALEEVGEEQPRLRALLLAFTAWARIDPDVPGTAVSATSEAVALAEVSGDPDVRCTTLAALGLALAWEARPEEARQALDRAELLTDGLDDPRTVLRPMVYRLFLAQRAGTPHEVVGLGREASARAERLGASRSVGQQVRTVLVDALVALGRWDEALEVIEDALMWTGSSLARTRLELARAEIAVRRGRLDEAEGYLGTRQAMLPAALPRWSLVAAELAWCRGDTAESRFQAARGLELVRAATGPDELGSLTHALVRAASAPGGSAGVHDRPSVDEALAQLAHLRAHAPYAAWYETARAEAAADPAQAVCAWRAALAAWRGLDHQPMVATACYGLAAALVRRGPAPDAVDDGGAAGREPLDEVEVLLEEAGRLSATMGAGPLLRQIQALSSSAGTGARVGLLPGPRVGDEDLGLTARELEVLGLVAEGWANKRIAAELGISPRTVGIHVSRILEKLTVSSRGEAAALALRLGLVAQRA